MKNKNKAKNYHIPLFLLIILIGCIGAKTIFSGCVQLYSNLVDTRNARPEYGNYYCEELKAEIVFGEEIIYFYSDNTSERLLLPVGKSADFDGESGSFYATYYWDQENDLLKLSFSQYPEGFEKSKEYIFRKEK